VITGPLEGYTIGVTADRRADEQMKLLAGRGAECLHGPVIKTHPLGSEEELRVATERVLADPPQRAVLTTGLGVRGWLEAADAIRLGDELREALSGMELFARGPKATGALVTAGFEVAWTAPRARYDDIIDTLAERPDLVGSRIAVQLDGAGAAELCDRVEELGIEVVRVPVYRWSLPEDTTAAERLIRAVVDRRVDAVTFTAKPAVENFLEIAGLMGVLDELVVALADVEVFCVGPVCATGFDDHPGIDIHVPDRHRLGGMVQQIASRFADRGADVVLAGAEVRVQGRLVVIRSGGDAAAVAHLSDRERALLAVLLERPGAVHSKRDLLRRVWHGSETDEHLVEVTVARLRQRLGPAAEGIETVVRRGYRVAV
jgi:uroporphyrinogen-III synthase